jgi:hypothetical protein
VTPLQERLAGTGWLYEPPSRDRWDHDVPPRLWALGLLVPTVSIKAADTAQPVLDARVRMENGAEVRIFFDCGEPEGNEVWLHLMVEGHHAKADDRARIIASCCPGEGRATEGHDGELVGCQATNDWAEIDGATPADLLRWLPRLSTYRVVAR